MRADSVLAARKAAINRELSFFDDSASAEVINKDAPTVRAEVSPIRFDKHGSIIFKR